MRLAISISLLVLCAAGAEAQKQELPTFMGRKVTLTAPPLDGVDNSPKAPASLCIEGPPERQCYQAPKDFGARREVTVLEIGRGKPALLLSVDSGGVSGFLIHFALLRPGRGKDLEDLFPNVTVSNESRYAFWNEPAVSDVPIFVTADFIWGPDESHYAPHRFMISVYTLEHPSELGTVSYYLKDRYMTVRKYDEDPPADILAVERTEILSRLRRVKAEESREQDTKH